MRKLLNIKIHNAATCGNSKHKSACYLQEEKTFCTYNDVNLNRKVDSVVDTVDSVLKSTSVYAPKEPFQLVVRNELVIQCKCRFCNVA